MPLRRTTKLKKIKLPVRVRSVLCRHYCCETVSHVRELGPSAFFGVPNCGPQTREEIRRLFFAEDEWKRAELEVDTKARIRDLINRRSAYRYDKWMSGTPVWKARMREFDAKLSKLHVIVGEKWEPLEPDYL